MLAYLTFTNEFDGVYSSQVVDVCRFLEAEFDVHTHVIAVVSARRYLMARQKFRSVSSRITAVPMVPGIQNWRKNKYLLRVVVRRLRCRQVIGRSEFATQLGLMLRDDGDVSSVCFDGRSARAAECLEYPGQGRAAFTAQEIAEIEGEAILRSDFRLAVSKALVAHWRERYGYEGSTHRVVPCTLGRSESDARSGVRLSRRSLGIQEHQIVLVYSGSAAEWQSLEIVDDVMTRIMSENAEVVLLLLSRVDLHSLGVGRFYPSRVIQRWLEPQLVESALLLADYGLLLRERSVTNAVASPTKFAEYLNAGLNVLISEGVGDLTEFVRREGCGQVLPPGDTPEMMHRVDEVSRTRNVMLAQEYFSKSAHREAYRDVLHALGSIDTGHDA